MRMWLDSGAFGAWNSGVTIDLDGYAEFVKRHQSLIYAAANLDVIPGKHRVRFRSEEATAHSARQGYENFRRLTDAGLSVIPVFHEGESFDWLERYLADGAPYVGLATRGKRGHAWLDQCFALLTGSNGQPLVRTHGFGLTSPRLILRYPWHSVDSTRALKNFGTWPCPRRGADGKPDFEQKPEIVHSGDGDHHRPLGSLTEARPWIDEWLAQVGVNVPLVANDIRSRRKVFIYYFQQLENWVNARRPATWFPLHIVFATALGDNELNDMKVENRLVSYFNLIDKPDKLARYAETCGKTGRPPRTPKQNWDREAYLRHRRVGLLNRMGLGPTKK